MPPVKEDVIRLTILAVVLAGALLTTTYNWTTDVEDDVKDKVRELKRDLTGRITRIENEFANELEAEAIATNHGLQLELTTLRNAMALAHQELLSTAIDHADKKRAKKFDQDDIKSRDEKLTELELRLKELFRIAVRNETKLTEYGQWLDGIANRGRVRTKEIAELKALLQSMRTLVDSHTDSLRLVEGKQDNVREQLERIKAELAETIRKVDSLSPSRYGGPPSVSP